MYYPPTTLNCYWNSLYPAVISLGYDYNRCVASVPSPPLTPHRLLPNARQLQLLPSISRFTPTTIVITPTHGKVSYDPLPRPSFYPMTSDTLMRCHHTQHHHHFHPTSYLPFPISFTQLCCVILPCSVLSYKLEKIMQCSTCMECFYVIQYLL